MAESNAAVRCKQLSVSIQQCLFCEARSAAFNLSGVLEEALDAHLRAGRIARWREENREAIEEFNAYIKKYGIFCEAYRYF